MSSFLISFHRLLTYSTLRFVPLVVAASKYIFLILCYWLYFLLAELHRLRGQNILAYAETKSHRTILREDESGLYCEEADHHFMGILRLILSCDDCGCKKR